MLSSFLIVATCCHSTASNRPSSIFCLKRQSQANPLWLKLITSVLYLRNDRRQTHYAYLACFQRLSLEKRPLFRKRIVERSECRFLSCPPSTRCRAHPLAGHENMPTVKAGRWFGISSLTGKLQIGVGSKPTSHHPIGRPDERGEARVVSSQSPVISQVASYRKTEN